MPARVYMDLPCWNVLYGEVTSVREEACATLDTGCQRTAVGEETLKQMRGHWPQELKWFKQNEVNRFRSVNGLSQTEYNAVIPCGIGKKGCYMKPAVFAGEQSKHAPFLVSLQFLLHCDAVISLASGKLELRLRKCNTTIPLHIGPSKALKLPMNRFDSVMIDSLRKAEVNLEDRRGKEFELLNLAQVSSGNRPTSHPGEPLRSESHGWCQQATPTLRGDRGTGSPTLANPNGALPLRHPPDCVLGLQLGPRRAGDEYGQPDRGRGHPDPLPQGSEDCALRPDGTTASEHEMGGDGKFIQSGDDSTWRTTPADECRTPTEIDPYGTITPERARGDGERGDQVRTVSRDAAPPPGIGTAFIDDEPPEQERLRGHGERDELFGHQRGAGGPTVDHPPGRHRREPAEVHLDQSGRDHAPGVPELSMRQASSPGSVRDTGEPQQAVLQLRLQPGPEPGEARVLSMVPEPTTAGPTLGTCSSTSSTLPGWRPDEPAATDGNDAKCLHPFAQDEVWHQCLCKEAHLPGLPAPLEQREAGSQQVIPEKDSASKEFLPSAKPGTRPGCLVDGIGDASSDLHRADAKKKVCVRSDLSEACELARFDLVGDRVERLACVEFLQSLKPTCVHVRCSGRLSWKRELSLALEFAVTCSEWKPKIVIEHPWFLHKREHHLVKEFLRKQARGRWHVVNYGHGGALTNWDKLGNDDHGDFSDHGDEPGEFRWQVRKRLAKQAGRPEDQVTYFDVNDAVIESQQRHERIKELLLIGEDEFQHYHVEPENGGPPSNESSHEDDEQEDEPRRPLPGERRRTVQDLVRRAHDGLGHPHRERFLRILKEAKASDEVMKAAKDLKCSVCEKFAQTRPQRRAAPPREHGINEVLGMDTVWLPYIRGRRRIALNVIDYSSHFQMVIPMRGRSPEAAWGAYRTWVKFFGPPKQIWADQGGEFKGVFKTKAGLEGTHVEPSSLESPFQRGVAERHGKTFKIILEKAMVEYACQTHDDWLELVDMSIMMKNRLASRGGFSPVQRVLG